MVEMTVALTQKHWSQHDMCCDFFLLLHASIKTLLMLLNIIYIVCGVAVVLWGADRMTDGAVVIARRLKIPPFVIGLTVLAIGTSAPEFFVSLLSAIKNTPDMAVGNVVGSNILNVLLVGGASAAVMPMLVKRSTIVRDVPILLTASLLLLVLSLDGNLSRLDCVLLFGAFLAFMVYTVRSAKGHAEESEMKGKLYKLPVAIGLIVLGLVCLVVGSSFFVDGASSLARALGVSDAVIGLTVVAAGTSMPELATSVVAARKGQNDIAIGNIIGSNIFNILMALGLTGIISPMHIEGITVVDFVMMMVSVVMLWLFSYSKLKLERWEGCVLLLVCAGYIWWLVANA